MEEHHAVRVLDGIGDAHILGRASRKRSEPELFFAIVFGDKAGPKAAKGAGSIVEQDGMLLLHRAWNCESYRKFFAISRGLWNSVLDNRSAQRFLAGLYLQ